MPRCAKIVRGKRCKAYCIAGSKFCLFHTPGQGMRRGRKKKNAEMDDPEVTQTKGRLRKMAENQVIGRGTRKLGALMTARGAFYASNQAIYDVTYRYNPARYNVQGTRIVGAHTQKTIEMRRTNGGRDFVATQTRKNPYGRPHHVHMGNKIYAYGRIVPVIGLGYVMYNTVSGEPAQLREGEGWAPLMAGYAVADASAMISAGYTPLETIDAALGAPSGYGMHDSAQKVGEEMVRLFD